MWMLENLLDLPGTAGESLFFEDSCPTSQLGMLSHQRAQLSLSTRAGGFERSSAEAQRMPPSVGSVVATVPEVLADLSDDIGEKIGRELPHSDLVRRIRRNIKDLHDVHGVSEESMANVVRESWRDKAFRAGEQGASGQSTREVLPAHDAETTNSSKDPAKIGVTR